MSSHQDIIAEPHIRTSRRSLKSCQVVYTFFIDISQDLHTRTSCEHRGIIFIQTPLQSIFKTSIGAPLEEDFSRFSTRFSHKDRGFHQHLWKSLRQGPVQGHAKASGQGIDQRNMTKIFMPGAQGESHDRCTRTCSCWRGSYKILLPRASHKSFHTSTSRTWHLQGLLARTS